MKAIKIIIISIFLGVVLTGSTRINKTAEQGITSNSVETTVLVCNSKSSYAIDL